MKINWRSHLITIGFVVGIVTLIALYETQTIKPAGRWGIALVLFLSPSFLYRLYLMWERRERLIDIYETSKIQMRAIKNSKKKKAKKHIYWRKEENEKKQ